MLQPLSQTAKALRDTTISKSAGEWFLAIAELWGIPSPGLSPQEYWREAVRSNAMGPRGVTRPVFDFVYWALKPFTAPAFTVDVDPGNSARLTGEGATTPFQQEHIGLWARRVDTGEVYQIQGPSDITSSGGAWVTCTDVNIWPWTKGAAFDEADTFDVEVLPFTIREEPGLVIIFVSELGISFTPGHYIQPDDSARPAGMPEGGHVLDDEFEIGDPNGVGPHPIYLSSGKLLEEYRAVLDPLLAAGVRCEFRTWRPGDYAPGAAGGPVAPAKAGMLDYSDPDQSAWESI